MSNIKKEMAVAALCNGIVIDHIPCNSLFKVVNLLGLENMQNSVTIGNFLESGSMGRKGIIKIADVDLPEETLNRIAVIAPHAVINIIRDYKVVEKHRATLADDLVDIVRCTNPKCICSVEPGLDQEVIQYPDGALRCAYCAVR